MVGLGRVELPTRSLGNCCSIHLSYSPATIPQSLTAFALLAQTEDFALARTLLPLARLFFPEIT
jgi:hypothetical protein